MGNCISPEKSTKTKVNQNKNNIAIIASEQSQIKQVKERSTESSNGNVDNIKEKIIKKKLAKWTKFNEKKQELKEKQENLVIQIEDDSEIIEVSQASPKVVKNIDVKVKHKQSSEEDLMWKRNSRVQEKSFSIIMTERQHTNVQLLKQIKQYLSRYFQKEIESYKMNKEQKNYQKILMQMIYTWKEWLQTHLIKQPKLIKILVEAMNKTKRLMVLTNKIQYFLDEVEQNAVKAFSNLEQQAKIECLICAEDITFEQGAFLECAHIFHNMCVHDYLKSMVKSGQTKLKCPHDGCQQQLSQYEIGLYLDENTFEKYNKFSINNFVDSNKNICWCPTANCTVAFQLQGDITKYDCNVCKNSYCLKCRCIFHEKLSCQDYQKYKGYDPEDRHFMIFVNGAKFKQCPKCSFWVGRTQGCNSMKCRCGQQFCYVCGGLTCPHGKCNNQ